MAYAQLAFMVIGGLSAASAQRRAGKAEQMAYEYNAKLDEVQAAQEDMELRESLRRERQLSRTFSGNQRARFAAGGVATSSGSPLEVMGRDAGRMELAALERARVGEARRRSILAGAESKRFSGRAARSAGNNQSVATLLNTGANTFGAASYYRRIGAI